MHLSEEHVQRLLHGELTPAVAMEVKSHLESCPECRDRVSQAEREERWVLDRLRAIDHSPPSLRIADLARRSTIYSGRRWGRLAAGIFIGAAIAGAAYAAPGSPLPKLVSRILGTTESSQAARRAQEPAESVMAPEAGIAVAPGNRLTISFEGAGFGDTAAVSLTDSAHVVIRASGGHTSFASAPEHLVIEHRGGPSRFEVLIPRAAPLVELEVGGRRMLLKQASGVTSAAVPDGTGRYLIPLGASP